MNLEIDRSAAVERIALGDGSSWVDVVRRFVPEATELVETLQRDTPWQQGETLRFDKYVPEKRLGAMLKPERAPAAVRQTGMHLDSHFRVRFTGAGALLYRDGNDFQGLHSDREMKWLDDTLVAIVVLGERRPFIVRERKGTANERDTTPAGQAPDDIDIAPGHGDLLVMGGRCQRDWLHGVPAAPTDKPRISLTWRWTSRRGAPDTNPGYYDGRQFSDRPRRPGYRSR